MTPKLWCIHKAKIIKMILKEPHFMKQYLMGPTSSKFPYSLLDIEVLSLLFSEVKISSLVGEVREKV